MTAKIADIIKAMDCIAPLALAEKWDNVGLQIGDKDWPVRTVRISLDPSVEVVTKACRESVDLLITHHPLIFKPLERIDFGTPIGSIIYMATQHKMSLFTAHTNLDIASDGLNDILAEKVGMKNVCALREIKSQEEYRLVVFCPKEKEPETIGVLSGMAAVKKINVFGGRSGIGRDQDVPADVTGASFVRHGERQITDVARIETVVKKNSLRKTVEELKRKLPNERFDYEAYPLASFSRCQGLGRVGEVEKELKFSALAEKIKKDLGLKAIRVAGNPELEVKKVAICSGSGSSLLPDFLSSGAQVYISGDLRFHDAKIAQENGLGLIDIGHFGSEHLIVDILAERLQNILDKEKYEVQVESYELENDPFETV